jgi:homogentisate 1,2-dioxygenase
MAQEGETVADKRTLAIPASEGVFARQAHAELPEGTYEREIGRDGFFGAATHMYHRNSPTAFDSISGSIRPRAFNPIQVNKLAASPWDAMEMFHNASTRVRFWRTNGTMPHLVRNADGDDLLFVHNGAGDFYCDYGHLRFETGDYLLVPRGTMWRIVPEGEADLLLIESSGNPYTMPNWGGIGRHAPIDFGAFDRPVLNEAFRAQQGGGRWEVVVKRQNELGRVGYCYNPLDAVGWKGDLYPVRLNIRDIRPLMSHRMHLPPSAHTTFLGNRFVVCTFVPRPLESDPGAMKLPFFHNNDDYDEVLFSHRGPIGSRGGAVSQGGLTYHPMGFTHGPHPEVMPYMYETPSKESSSYLVMVDAQDPLTVGNLPQGCEVEGYSQTWLGSLRYAPDAESSANGD